MKRLFLLLTLTTLVSCTKTEVDKIDVSQSKKAINSLLNDWHKAAATANYNGYFSKMDSVSIFIGTDATENWSKKAFEDFSKPYFDKGKAWSFVAAERNIYVNEAGDFAWFDELLNTWMGACRGSGVLEKKGSEWKIKHYVLSVTVPNDDIQKLLKIKFKKDSIYLKKLMTKL